jgi:DNA-binding NarL/FixJ family response regulator
MIRVLICDDHDLVRAGLVRIVESDPRFSVVAEASNRENLIAQLRRTQDIDVLLLDLNLDATGVATGIELIEMLHAAWRALAIIVVSMHDDVEIVSQALQVGARGYVTKDCSASVLQEAIVQVHQGRHYLAPNLVEPVVLGRGAQARQRWDALLTPREREVLTKVCAGQRLSDIAANWGVSIKTVSTHKVRLMEKLKVTNNAELIKLALRHGAA